MRSCRLLVALVLGLTVVLPTATAIAVTDCVFDIAPSTMTMTLTADCTTDGTIGVPYGYTLDGAGYTITAVDPVGDHFRGAVIANDGATASVVNVRVTASGLANACDGGDDRLRGIMFDGASGVIAHNVVSGINQGASGCQEGNAIEVRNAPFDGTHPNTVSVAISHNEILDYQKTGIVANGDVDVTINHNRLGASATQANLAANGIQVGFGASGVVSLNRVAGNQWMGTSDFAATAVLIFDAGDGLLVERNDIVGNSDIGLYVSADNGTYSKNHLVDQGVDHPNSGYDIGVGNWGSDNTVVKNHVRGFDIPFDGVDDGGKNKVLPAG